MSKGNGRGFVHEATAVLLGPQHVDDLTDAVVALNRTIRRLDETLQASVAAMTSQNQAIRELIQLMQGVKPANDLSPSESDL